MLSFQREYLLFILEPFDKPSLCYASEARKDQVGWKVKICPSWTAGQTVQLLNSKKADLKYLLLAFARSHFLLWMRAIPHPRWSVIPIELVNVKMQLVKMRHSLFSVQRPSQWDSVRGMNLLLPQIRAMYCEQGPGSRGVLGNWVWEQPGCEE